jgi:hypothetical protein
VKENLQKESRGMMMLRVELNYSLKKKLKKFKKFKNKN